MKKKRGFCALLWVMLLGLLFLSPVRGENRNEKVRLPLAEQSLSSRTASVTWNKVEGARGYEVSYATSADFEEEQVFFWEGEKTCFTGEYGKRYYVRVRAVFDGKEKETEDTYGPWSRTVSCKLERPLFRSKEKSIAKEKKIEVSRGGNLGGGGMFSKGISGTYSDAYWASSKREDIHLLRLSVLALYASYGESRKDLLQRGALQEFFEDCGFATEGIVSFFTGRGEESTREDYDHCTLYTASKELEDSAYGKRKLIALVISGYSKGGYEWLSNLSLGEGKVHEGFLASAEEVVRFLKHHYPDLSDSILWICGHSRGAAITGLVAERLLMEKDAPVIYAYGFGTPNVEKEDKEEKEGIRKKEEESILNLALLGDLVPETPPHAWGYEPLGKIYRFDMDAKARRFYRRYFGTSYQGMNEGEKEALLEEFLDLVGQQEEFSEEERKENLAKALFTRERRKEGTSMLSRNRRTTVPTLASPHTIEAYLSFLFSHHFEEGAFVAD